MNERKLSTVMKNTSKSSPVASSSIAPTKPKRVRRRDPDNTVTSFSVSKDLLKEAKAMARDERRPLSNFISMILEEKIKERKRLMMNGD